MERTDWLDAGLDPADARFLMMTAITHHRFSAPIWGEPEVRKLLVSWIQNRYLVNTTRSGTPYVHVGRRIKR